MKCLQKLLTNGRGWAGQDLNKTRSTAVLDRLLTKVDEISTKIKPRPPIVAIKYTLTLPQPQRKLHIEKLI